MLVPFARDFAHFRDGSERAGESGDAHEARFSPLSNSGSERQRIDEKAAMRPRALRSKEL
ncbi:hypothetical protein BH23GEM8_BH23GEM8_11240 [soil metagenome]